MLHRGAVIDRRPLVGRTAELAAAVGLLEGSTAGQAGALLVTGEAGIGKTALVREVCRLSGGAAEVIWGSCLPLASRAVPFGTLSSAVRRWAEDRGGPPPVLDGRAGGAQPGVLAPWGVQALPDRY